MRGIRVGSARDGSLTYFIPDPNPAGGSSAAEGSPRPTAASFLALKWAPAR